MMDCTTSHMISDFSKFLAQVVNDYSFSKEEISRLDQLTQDYLHKLELQDGSYHDRAKIAAALRQCRIDRRFHKDRMSILEPIVQLLADNHGKTMVSDLSQLLGAVRKAERAIKDRRYIPRVLSQEEYDGHQDAG